MSANTLSERIRVSGKCPVCGKQAGRRLLVFGDLLPDGATFEHRRNALISAIARKQREPVYHAKCDPAVAELKRRRDMYDRRAKMTPLVTAAHKKLTDAVIAKDDINGRFWSRFYDVVYAYRDTGEL